MSRLRKVLDVSPSGYYAWRGRPASAREMANRELVKKIKMVYNVHKTRGVSETLIDEWRNKA